MEMGVILYNVHRMMEAIVRIVTEEMVSIFVL